MDGLEKIINEISAEAQAEAKKITDAAKAASKRVIDRAKEEARQVKLDAEEKAKLEYKRIISRANSAGEVISSRELLKTKQELISEIIDMAGDKIAELSDEEYFAFMTRLLAKYASGAKGELKLSARDKARVTQEFIEAAEKHNLTVSDKTLDIDGGFVLLYGDIEENCSIEALISDERDKLHDTVNEFLFG